MARDWKAVFETWTKPASDTEAGKQANAERMIRDAVSEHDTLRGRNIKVIAQGSYRNNTNVRAESDVDICVCCMVPFFYDYTSADYTMQESNVVAAAYTFREFKNDVEAALVQKFGRAGVFRGTKAFDAHANTYRVGADVVATFAHRRYQKKVYDFLRGGSYIYPYTEPEGTQFLPDGGGNPIVNWPEQHYTNGVAKNKATGFRFKSAVRALKNMKYEIEEFGNPAQKKAAKEAPSYLIECLVYNVQNLAGDSYYDTVRNVITVAYNATKTDETCKRWLEANEMKWLFRPTQPWTREQAHAFLLEAWRYAEFK